MLTEEESRGNLRIRDFVSTLMSRLDYFLYNNECDFMRIDQAEYRNAADYLDKVLGITDDKERQKQLITIDSSEVGTDVLELMTSVISRMMFDYRKQRSAKNAKNVLFILFLMKLTDIYVRMPTTLCEKTSLKRLRGREENILYT